MPPPLGSSFEYLPSVYPPNEQARLSMSNQYDVLWPYWGQDKAGALIRTAMKQFGTKFASLSFFDENNEVFKAENGYNQPHVDRAASIAAHCLLSKDVLVVLDTNKVRRFPHLPFEIQLTLKGLAFCPQSAGSWKTQDSLLRWCTYDVSLW